MNGGGADWLEYLWPVRSGDGIDYSVVSGYLNWTTSLGSRSGQHALIQRHQPELDPAELHVLDLRHRSADRRRSMSTAGLITTGTRAVTRTCRYILTQAGLVSWVSGPTTAGTSVDNPGSGAVIFGHELTHDYNVYHTNTGSDDCGSDDGNSDFPYTTSSIQEFGFNPDTGKIYDPATDARPDELLPAGVQAGLDFARSPGTRCLATSHRAADLPSHLGLSPARTVLARAWR